MALKILSDQTNVRLNPPLIRPLPSWSDIWSEHPQTGVIIHKRARTESGTQYYWSENTPFALDLGLIRGHFRRAHQPELRQWLLFWHNHPQINNLLKNHKETKQDCFAPYLFNEIASFFKRWFDFLMVDNALFGISRINPLLSISRRQKGL